MNVLFLLFVIAILLFAIFWELCKINSRLKKTLSVSMRASENPNFDMEGRSNDKISAKAAD